MDQIEIKSSQIFGMIKKFFPVYLKYIHYFTLLFIAMFISLGLTATIIYLINCNESWNATLASSSAEIIINKGNYHLFLQWLFSNKNAVYIGFAASFFGFASCLSILVEVAIMIKSNKIVSWKLSIYTFVFILFFVASFMISFGFNNSNIPIGINRNNVIQTQGPITSTQAISITENRIPWTTITIPGSSDTGNQINIPVGLNPEKGNYVPYLVSTISISILGNILYLVNKVLRKLNIKIVWNGFKNKEDNDKVNKISDDLLEMNKNNPDKKDLEIKKPEQEVKPIEVKPE